jgi:hypothetical protein
MTPRCIGIDAGTSCFVYFGLFTFGLLILFGLLISHRPQLSTTVVEAGLIACIFGR